ncbi:MAG: hypothetical protein HOM16_01525 [Woeseia sp.]|nr:hypothetical protein [Woeseia sp.]
MLKKNVGSRVRLRTHLVIARNSVAEVTMNNLARLCEECSDEAIQVFLSLRLDRVAALAKTKAGSKTALDLFVGYGPIDNPTNRSDLLFESGPIYLYPLRQLISQ